jgi:MFS family permease
LPRLTRTLPATVAAEEGLASPRTDVVLEAADGPGRFIAAIGPFAGYERILSEHDDVVTEVVRYRLAPGFAAFPFTAFYRSALRRSARPGTPWWAPPEPLDRRAGGTIGSLCAIAVVVGYLGTLLTQTVTFAADEFDAGKTAQSATLAAVRIGVIATVLITATADRRGRRRLLLLCSTIGCVACGLGALSPNLWGVGLSQLVVRTLVSACTVLLTVIAAEEMPRGARAYGITLLGLSGALGVGVCLIALPVADLGTRGWRLLYLLPLLGLFVLRHAGRQLPESRRYEVPHDDVPMRGHSRRLYLLAISALLLNLFKDPASQLLNEFLRDERGYSAARISLFSIVTNVPGFLGVLVGGRIADVRGRRTVGAVAVVGGAGFTVVQMLAHGWEMWILSLVASVIGAAAIPALGVYGPELFPTSLRGRANGVIAVLGVAGTMTGLLLAGLLSDRWDGLGPALAVLSIGPLLVAGLILVAYPETAHQALEDLNPEDPVLDGLSPSPAPPPSD